VPKGPRFAAFAPEPDAGDDVPFAEERSVSPPPVKAEQTAKPEPVVTTYAFKDALAGTGTIPQPVDEFAHVSPTPQVAPLADIPRAEHVPPAKLAPLDAVPVATAPVVEEAKAASQEELYQYRLSDAERKPYRPPPLPENPLWTGVWNFAWQGSSIKMFLWQTLGFTVLLLQFGLLALCIRSWDPAGGSNSVLAGMGLIFIGISALFVILQAGSYAAACTLKVVEETANGEHEIPGPDGSWKEWLVSLFRLGLVMFFGLLPCGLLSLCFGPIGGTFVSLALWPAIFNTFFLSVLGGSSMFSLLHGPTLEKLGAKFGVAMKMYLWTLVLLSVITGVMWLTVGVSAIFALVGGALTAACCLTYARVMGRVGSLLLADEVKARKKRRKKRNKNFRPDVPMPEGAPEPAADDQK
jgi:hypothetical protein